MSDNLIEQISQTLSGDLLNRLGSAVGGTPAMTQSALSGAAPGVLAAMLQKSGTGDGAGQLLDLLTRGNHDSLPGNLAGALGGGDATSSLMRTGAALLPALFGNRSEAMSDYIGGLSGLNRGSAQSLLSLVAPIVMGLVTRQLRSAGGLNVNSLISLLTGQRRYIEQAAPAGLAGALGLGSLGDLGSSISKAGSTPRAGGTRWRWILLLIALLLGFLLLRDCGSDVETTPATREAVPAPSLEAPPPVGVPALVERQLPDGTVIRIVPTGVESQLIAFIEDGSRPVDETTWFTMDRMEFETGSATLRPGSAAQLDNIAAILKAWPDVKLKFGGYTDNTGDPVVNLKLSSDRANSAMTEVVNRGIAADRVAAEGYGDQFPVGDNATDEGRQRNRRIDIRVTAK